MEEDSKSPVDAEHTTPERDTVSNRTAKDEALPAGLYLGHSVQSMTGTGASSHSLPEDIGYRSFSQSTPANRQSPWRLVSSPSSATSSSSLDVVPPCEGVISDDSGFVILTKAEGGEDRSCSESSQTLFLHPARFTGPSPVSEMSQAVTPSQGEVEPEMPLSLEPSDQDLYPLQLLHSEPIDIPAGSKHHLETPNTLDTGAGYCHSDCDSAILEPRSPPQESALVTCPYCLITAPNGDCLCGKVAAVPPRSPLLERFVYEYHRTDSDVSFLDLGPGFFNNSKYYVTSTTESVDTWRKGIGIKGKLAEILSDPSPSSVHDEGDENQDPDHARHASRAPLAGHAQNIVHRRRRSQGLLASARAVFRPRLLPREDSQPLSVASAASSSIMTVSSKSGLGTPFPVDEDFFDEACALAITAANTLTGTTKENIPPVDNPRTNDNTPTDNTPTDNTPPDNNDHTDNDNTHRV